MYPESTLKRFLDKVNIGAANECWEWRACRHYPGYGRFGIGTLVYQAHRISFEIFKGPIPLGMNILHRCNNPSCVNPIHLYAGTQKDNHADSVRAGTNSPPPLNFGEGHNRGKLTEKQVIEIRQRYDEGVPSRVLSKEYSVAKSSIVRIINRTFWKHVP